MKKLLILSALLTFAALAMPVRAQLTTNQPATPTSQGSFFNQVFDWFTRPDPALEGAFTNGNAILWAGIDSVQGGNSSLVNEIGLSYAPLKTQRISLEAVTRNGGVTGVVISQGIGASINFNIHDMRLCGYLDGLYYLDENWRDNGQELAAETGIRAFKALGVNTFAYVSFGVGFPKSRQIFGAGIGIRF